MVKFKPDILEKSDKKRADSVEEWLEIYPCFLNTVIVPLAYLAHELYRWLQLVDKGSPLLRDKTFGYEHCFIQPPDCHGFFISLYAQIGAATFTDKKNNSASWFDFDFATAFNRSTNHYKKLRGKLRGLIRKLFGLPEVTPQYAVQTRKYLHHLLAEIRKEISQPPAQLVKKFHQPEFLFLVEIALPSWFCFQETVDDLLDKIKRAPEQNFYTLQKLLRLNKGFLSNPLVNRVYCGLTESQSKLIHRAIETGIPDKKRTARDIQYTIIALIMEMHAQFTQMLTASYQREVKQTTRLKKTAKTARKQKIVTEQLSAMGKTYTEIKGVALTFPAIRNLFDLVNREQSGNNDLPPTEKGFANSIKRHKKFWAHTKFFATTPPKKNVELRE